MKEQISKLEENWNNLLDISYMLLDKNRILLNKNRNLQDRVDVLTIDSGTFIQTDPRLATDQLGKLYQDLGNAITNTNLNTNTKESKTYLNTLLDKISAARKNAGNLFPRKTKRGFVRNPTDDTDNILSNNAFNINGGKRRTRKRKMREKQKQKNFTTIRSITKKELEKEIEEEYKKPFPDFAKVSKLIKKLKKYDKPKEPPKPDFLRSLFRKHK